MFFHHYYNQYKKIGFIIILICIIIFGVNVNNVESYYFGLKSADNTPENILLIEKKLDTKLSIVSFIFDPWEENDVLNSIDKIVELLGTDRIYHFTVSPNNFSAEDVALGKFDAQYSDFFKKIKEKNLHVIFRTMHEMNGGWYPRSSNPEKFKAARIHVRTLSRLAGLDQENIAFDFSVNHWDMPTKGTPSQAAQLVKCSQGKKDCYHFEDYYPGDEYVDVMGFTFYNWGKAMDNRQRLSPIQILYDKNWKTYERIKSFNKPIVIDEVATTSVRYEGKYDFDKSKEEYLNHNERKDNWLHQLWEFLINRPEIIATIYFNTDYTHGLSFKVVGEADWAIINIEDDKVYGGFWDLQLFSEKDLDNILGTLFNLKKFTIEGKDFLMSQKCSKDFTAILSAIKGKSTVEEKKLMISKLQGIKHKSECTSQTLKILSEIYSE